MEYIGLVRWQPLKRLVLRGRLLRQVYGADSGGMNWGGNILLSYSTRVQNFGNTIGQGIGTSAWIGGVEGAYQIRHNVYLDLYWQYRRLDSEIDGRDRITSVFGGGVRVNMVRKWMDF